MNAIGNTSQALSNTPTQNANAGSANGASGTSGQGTFVQALAQVMNGGTKSDSGNAGTLASLLLPGLLDGTEAEAQAGETAPADALLQLLGQLLNGMQASQEGNQEDAQAADALQDGNALAQLQLLLLQWLSAANQNPASANADPNGSADSLAVETSNGQASAQLLQLLTALLNQTSQDSGSQANAWTSFQALLKPVLEEVQTSMAQAKVVSEQTGGQAAAAVETESNGSAHQELPVRAHARRPLHNTTNTANAASGLVQLVADGRSYSGLSMIAAKASLQAPAAPTAAAGSAEAPLTDGQAVETDAAQAEHSDSMSGPATFRIPTEGANVNKTETPVVSARRFVQDMSQLLKSMHVQNDGGHSSIKITLMPEHLGQVDVKMSMQNGHLVAQFVADSVHGKDMLESQLPQLRAVLQSQGLQVERLEVTQGQAAAYAGFQEQQRQQQSQQFQRQGQGAKLEGDEAFVDFDAELAQLSARRAAIAGSSFDVSA